MTTYYLEVRMTKSSGHYWTIGLKFDAESFRGAVNPFDVWSFGVESVSSLTPCLLSINSKAAPERSYFGMDSAKEILEELTKFMREDFSFNDLSDERPSTDDDCPF